MFSGKKIFADLVCFIFVLELEFKAQKENFEKQSYAIQSDAEVKLAEIQAFLEAERDRHRIEVLNLDVLINFALEARAK